ncbi:hypothetical protein H5410_004173, partial [Solanum commersonii]
ALIADFEVSEGIYSRARIEESDSVCLWLGANVMLEYLCEEVSVWLLPFLRKTWKMQSQLRSSCCRSTIFEGSSDNHSGY